MDSNCDNACNLAMCLLGLLIILLALRYYYINRVPIEEPFEANNLNQNIDNNIMVPKEEAQAYHPCSPENFKKSLYEFYKSAQNYRVLEKELKDAQVQYEDKYQIFLKHHQNLSYHKDRISQCVNDV